MVNFETPLKRLKFLVLREVASLVMKNKLNKEELIKIPYKIIKGKDKAEYRCCVYKERAVLYERALLASGFIPTDNITLDLKKIDDRDHMMYVLSAACDRCPIYKYSVTEACRGCIQHKCMEVCPANAITRVNGRSHIDHDVCKECGMCKKVCPYNAIAEVMRPCKKSCPTGALEINPDSKKAQIDKEKCINCGACMAACPFGAVADRSYIAEVTGALCEKKDIYAVAAPAITGQFGPKVTVGQLKSAFKKIGFKNMVEVACGADAVTVNESDEFVNRMNSGDKYMTSSCCPGFVSYIETKFPSEVSKISSTVSPMVAVARMIKEEDKNAVVVFVGPCTAKKSEINRDSVRGAVDYVLTFEEIFALMGAFGVKPESCDDIPVDDASLYGRGFAQQGGLTAAVENCIGDKKDKIDFKPVKASGRDEIKKAMVIARSKRLHGNFIEGMMCQGGCIGGPGTMVSLMKSRPQLIKFSRKSSKKSVLSNENLEKFKKVNLSR
ncbi:4Fe-4S dicluster domain-containing protein [uncultured Clostridium sp.]|uniref:4Fe-4S dicluster domain-containing protein n=1 Tax=uncultured Clostridium sp. TaxID=59620 RepID=UPI0025F9FD18|nr:4Fe-4S dicluster domain-containing protein [uncultured Clostridium sp.]NLU08471.1 4Fe-4S binding protein [Clostridiales bacterium]